MKSDKAREFFSSYYEGSLDSSLRTQFESLMQHDPTLREEYADFAASLDSLGALSQVDIEVPSDLHERISARLDRHIYEQNQAKPKGLAAFKKFWMIGGLVTGAAAATLILMNNKTPSPSAEANVISIPTMVQKASHLDIESVAGETRLVFYATANEVITVTRLADGTELDTFRMSKGDKLSSKLTNSGRGPLTLNVQRQNVQESFIVVLPGSEAKSQLSGEGNLVELAEAMAGSYQKAVVLYTKGQDNLLRWTLNEQAVTQPKLSTPGIIIETKGELIKIRN